MCKSWGWVPSFPHSSQVNELSSPRSLTQTSPASHTPAMPCTLLPLSTSLCPNLPFFTHSSFVHTADRAHIASLTMDYQFLLNGFDLLEFGVFVLCHTHPEEGLGIRKCLVNESFVLSCTQKILGPFFGARSWMARNEVYLISALVEGPVLSGR